MDCWEKCSYGCGPNSGVDLFSTEASEDHGLVLRAAPVILLFVIRASHPIPKLRNARSHK
jgi:hypothetical protein